MIRRMRDLFLESSLLWPAACILAGAAIGALYGLLIP